MLRESMSSVLTEAEARVKEIDAQLAAMRALEFERDVLQRFCMATRDAISQQAAFASPPAVESDSSLQRVTSSHLGEDIERKLAPEDDKLWKAIQVVMGMRVTPMTAGEVLEALEAQNISMGGEDKNKRETVRSAILRKSDIFERVGRGIFALKEWPDRIKNLRKDDDGLMQITTDTGLQFFAPRESGAEM